MKLFQVNESNFITIDSVASVTLQLDYAVVITTVGVKHRITLAQARLLISCFEVIKPIIEATLLPNNGR